MVELRLCKILGGLAKDLIGLLQLAVLTFQHLHLLRHLGCDAATLAGINLDLLDSFIQCLWGTADLRGNRHNRRPTALMLPFAIQNYPHRTFADF